MTDDATARQPGPIIRLDDFLKCRGVVATGGEAKVRIQAGEVCLNGERETRRRKQLVIGDVIEWGAEILIVNETDFD
ncbi:RNA-binding S4 domain-containing protein [Novipirellula artificiosorum]|uniref:Ribosome-associated protein n=1 Tax=Novipirellula artificiosorum TaxID=2528016 RepID=A0A5C6DQW3_9BACT|nr:RNA-binding S4 domain-containing protein [Novipirellula artificiosorum]TWU37396.1 ribosome-associated protein [Novipirellula artificiosorum]